MALSTTVPGSRQAGRPAQGRSMPGMRSMQALRASQAPWSGQRGCRSAFESASARAISFAAREYLSRHGLHTMPRAAADDAATASADPPAAALAAAAAAAAQLGATPAARSGAAAGDMDSGAARSSGASSSGSAGMASASSTSSNGGDGPGGAAPGSSGAASGAGNAASSAEEGGGDGPPLGLVLSSGAAMLPHPDKVDKGGEDSYFIAEAHACLGVADGVGGWAEIGVDAGAYARLLMRHAKEEAEAAAAEGGPVDPQTVLERAFYRTDVQGSSTACVLCLNGRTLHASNLGDSGFLIVRGGRCVFQSPQQQHNFNFPYQLGSVDSMSDQPQAAMRFELAIEPGDIVVTGSDGLWDNVFADEVATIVTKCASKGESPETAAQVLARYARMRASDSKYNSPFSYAAIQAGYVYLGGKLDDVSAVVSYVRVSPMAAASPGPAGDAATPTLSKL